MKTTKIILQSLLISFLSLITIFLGYLFINSVCYSEQIEFNILPIAIAFILFSTADITFIYLLFMEIISSLVYPKDGDINKNILQSLDSHNTIATRIVQNNGELITLIKQIVDNNDTIIKLNKELFNDKPIESTYAKGVNEPAKETLASAKRKPKS